MLPDQLEHIFDGSPLQSMPGFAFEVTGQGFIDLRADGTFHYEPAFNAVISVEPITGTASWTGTLDGTWRIDGSTLVMAHTANQIVVDIEISGVAIDPPVVRTFEGEAEILSCEPMTFSYQLDGPTGPIVQTLVLAG